MINKNELNLLLFISLETLNLFHYFVGGDSHVSNSKGIGQLCWSSVECQMYSKCTKADESHRYGTCQCIPGYIQTDTWIQCIEPRYYKESCDYSQQCRHYDPNTVCETDPGKDNRLRCLCNDFHKYNVIKAKCEWCEEYDCRRRYQRYTYDESFGYKYNRWYHNVNGIFGMWASLLIVALPISLFLFFLGIRFTKQLMRFYTREVPLSYHRNETNISSDLVETSHDIFVRLPPEVVVPPESPPAYEELAKTIRLPTYEEAITMNS